MSQRRNRDGKTTESSSFGLRLKHSIITSLCLQARNSTLWRQAPEADANAGKGTTQHRKDHGRLTRRSKINGQKNGQRGSRRSVRITRRTRASLSRAQGSRVATRRRKVMEKALMMEGRAAAERQRAPGSVCQRRRRGSREGRRWRRGVQWRAARTKTRAMDLRMPLRYACMLVVDSDACSAGNDGCTYHRLPIPTKAR